MKKFLVLFLMVPVVLALYGCSSSSGYVRTHPYLDKADREAMINGEVRPGFDKDMVRVAMGGPSNVSTTMTKEGSQEVWLYPDVTWMPLFGNVKNEYTYVYFQDEKVVKVRTTRGSEKYQEKLEQAEGPKPAP